METNIEDENINSEEQFNNAINKNRNAFVRVYMKGCGFCIQLEPEWKKLVNHIHNDSELKNKIKLISIDSNNLDNISSLKRKVNGFPTLIFIKNRHIDTAEKYADDPEKKEPRTYEGMLNFIEEKLAMSGGRKTHRRIKNRKGRKSRKTNRKRNKSRAGRGKSRSKTRQRTKTRSRN